MRRNSTGFTLIELLLAMAIASLLFGISSILLSNLIPRANLNSVTEILVAELRQQQQKAMIGEKNDSNLADEYGIYLEAQQYTLFQGDTFVPGAVSNVVTDLPPAIHLTPAPSQTLVFERNSGEILNYTGAQTITVLDTLTSETQTITLNQYGIPE